MVDVSALSAFVSAKQDEAQATAKAARIKLLNAYRPDAKQAEKLTVEDSFILLGQAGWTTETLSQQLQEVDRVSNLAADLVDMVGAAEDLGRAVQGRTANRREWTEAADHFDRVDTQLQVEASTHNQRISNGNEARRKLLQSCSKETQEKYDQDAAKLLDMRLSKCSLRVEIASLNKDIQPGADAATQSQRVSELQTTIADSEIQERVLIAAMKSALLTDFMSRDQTHASAV